MNDKSIGINNFNQAGFLASQTSFVKNTLLSKPNLVHEADVLELREGFKKTYKKPNDFFILHIGDCAESFDDCTEEVVFKKCDFYFDVARQLEQKLQKNVLVIGRIAGQYAKPRTEDFEQHNGVTLPIYRGDMINGYEFNQTARAPNAERILTAYECASRTMNFIDCYYQKFGKKIFTSHEALVLDYDGGLTRLVRFPESASTHWFNASAHTVWLGDRSRNSSQAHIEYLQSIQNPVGVKIGANQSPDTLIALLENLNPQREEGKIYLITRLGCQHVENKLPKLIEVVKAAGFPVLWCVDPMHGNTFKVCNEKKSRTLDDIIAETEMTMKIHKEMGTHLSGLHLEATFLPVTECVTKTRENAVLSDLSYYTTKCDPRLNPEQVKMLIDHFLCF